MDSEKSQLESPGESTPRIDNFKRIQGIGPVIESQLYRAGVRTYAQLASLTAEQIAELVENLPLLSVERIARQDWPGQARALAMETALIESGDEARVLDTHSLYATFTIELLLDADGQVRRTRVTHIQHGEEENWGGWDEDYLLRFFAEHAAINGTSATVPASRSAPERASRPDLFVALPSGAIDPADLAGMATDQSILEPSVATPDARAAQRSHVAPRLDIGDLTIDDGALDRQANVWPIVPSVRAKLGFRLSGPGAAQVAAQVLRSTIQIVACDLASGKSLVLAVGQARLAPNQLDYTSTLEFALPDDGHYQLIGIVLIAEAQLVGSVLGPVLRVVP
jgi:hypothetical protein